MLKVLRMHREEVSKIDASSVSEDLLNAAASAWDAAVELQEICTVFVTHRLVYLLLLVLLG